MIKRLFRNRKAESLQTEIDTLKDQWIEHQQEVNHLQKKLQEEQVKRANNARERIPRTRAG